MKGVIASFRRGRKTQTTNQMIVIVDGVGSKEEATKLIGKQVVWKAPGKAQKELKGKISAVHGGKGAVRVIFSTGMPGQSLGTKLEVI